MPSRKLIWPIATLVIGLASQCSAQPSEFAAGRVSYLAGEFKQASVHFQLALRDNPNDAEYNYWAGRACENLADIARPFGGMSYSRARAYLTKATVLAPGRADYRQELFSLLVDSEDSSRSALRQAQSILAAIPESDPEYIYMFQHLEAAIREHSSVAARLSRLFLAAPHTASRVGAAVQSAVACAARPTAQ